MKTVTGDSVMSLFTENLGEPSSAPRYDGVGQRLEFAPGEAEEPG